MSLKDALEHNQHRRQTRHQVHANGHHNQQGHSHHPHHHHPHRRHHNQAHDDDQNAQVASKKSYQPTSYYEMLDMEQQKLEVDQRAARKVFPIAPDGFIPNSVVRRIIRLIEEEENTVPERHIWRLKWKPPDMIAPNVEDEPGTAKNSEEQPIVFNWSDDEIDMDEQNVDEQDVHKPSLDRISTHVEASVDELLLNLREEKWFKVAQQQDEQQAPNIGSILRFLVTKLTERDSANHADVAEYIMRVKGNFKLPADLLDWTIKQLEDELDAFDPQIMSQNLKLIKCFGIETYKLVVGLLTLLKKKNVKKELLAEASDVLAEIANVTSSQVQMALTVFKEIQMPRYKNDRNFKLKDCLEQINVELQSKSIDALIERRRSDLLKLIAREEWIPAGVRDELRTCDDFMNYFMKALQTIKSKIIYEKLCQHIKIIYNEFNLKETTWEAQIVERFIANNVEAHAPKHLRVLDIDNLAYYLEQSGNDATRNEILVELLRSACCDTTRPEVMTAAYEALKTKSKMAEAFVEGLLSYYVSTSKEEEATTGAHRRQWAEILDGYKLHHVRLLSSAASAASAKNNHAKYISPFYQQAAAREHEHAAVATTAREHKKKHHHKEHKNKKSKKHHRDKAGHETSSKKHAKSHHAVGGGGGGGEGTTTAASTALGHSGGTTSGEDRASTMQTKALNASAKSVGSSPPPKSKSPFSPSNPKMFAYYDKRNRDLTVNSPEIREDVKIDINLMSISETMGGALDEYEQHEHELLLMHRQQQQQQMQQQQQQQMNAEHMDGYLNSEAGGGGVGVGGGAVNGAPTHTAFATLSSLERFDMPVDDEDEYFIRQMLVNSSHKSPKETLDAIKKRVVLNETGDYNTKQPTTTNDEPLNPMNNNNNNNNAPQYPAYDEMSRHRVPIKKLIECLIVRGLELHEHYEKFVRSLAPNEASNEATTTTTTAATGVTLPDPTNNTFPYVSSYYYTDCFVPHPSFASPRHLHRLPPPLPVRVQQQQQQQQQQNPKNKNQQQRQTTTITATTTTTTTTTTFSHQQARHLQTPQPPLPHQLQQQQQQQQQSLSDRKLVPNLIFNFDSLLMMDKNGNATSKTQQLAASIRQENVARLLNTALNDTKSSNYNHIALIKKLLSSNNELNFARYISSLGLNLNGQLDKLIAPIPSKIVPLIFWDPIVQKLASIFKSANNPEMNRSKQQQQQMSSSTASLRRSYVVSDAATPHTRARQMLHLEVSNSHGRRRLSTQREVNEAESDDELLRHSSMSTPRQLMHQQQQRSRVLRASIRCELRRRRAAAARAISNAVTSTTSTISSSTATTTQLTAANSNSNTSSSTRFLKPGEDEAGKQRGSERSRDLVYLPSLAFRLN